MQPQFSMTKKAIGSHGVDLGLSLKLLASRIHPKGCCHQEDTKHKPELHRFSKGWKGERREDLINQSQTANV